MKILNLKPLLNKVYFTIFLIITICFSFSTFVFASTDGYTVINKDSVAELSNSVISDNGEHFIALDDLKKINLNFTERTEDVFYIYRLYGSYKYGVTYDESQLKSDNSILYISLEELAVEFSKDFTADETEKTISLWINDYCTETYDISVTLSDDVVIPNDGLNVTVYSGKRSRIGVSTAGSGGSKYLGYEGTSLNIPSISDITKTDGVTFFEEKTITFTENGKTVSLVLDAELRSALTSYNSGGYYSGSSVGGSSSGSSGGGGSLASYTNYIGYYIDDENYLGGDRVSIDEADTFVSLNVNSIKEKASLYGSVTIPETENDISFKIIAEGNKAKKYNDNGSYNATRDYVFISEGTIPAGQNTADYELSVLSGADYTVSIVFDDRSFMRQEKIFKNLTGRREAVFLDFKESNKIKGTVKLPDDMTEFTNFYGEPVSTVTGSITLQQAKAPYYRLSTETFEIDTTEKYAEFVLIDDVGVDNVVIYYSLYDNITDIYGEGNYKNDNTTVAHVKNAGIIPATTDNVTVNIQKGITITSDLTYPADELELNLTGRIYESSEPTDDCIEVYAMDVSRTDRYYDILLVHKFTVPNEYNDYSLHYFNDMFGLEYDVKDSVCKRNIDDFDLFNRDTTEHYITFEGYIEEHPVIINSVDINIDCAYVNYGNPSVTDYDSLKCYLLFYDKEGFLQGTCSAELDADAQSGALTAIPVSPDKYKGAISVKCLLWTDTIVPLSMGFESDI